MLSLSSPTTAARLARLIADARERRGFSLRQLAMRADTSASHLSRIESGERGGVSRELLGRLAAVLDIEPADLFAAAQLLPPEVERQLADPDLAGALVDRYEVPASTRAALRRLHIGQLVERQFPAGPKQRHDPIALLRARGYAFELAAGSDAVTIEGLTVRCTTEREPSARFLAAHALGHVMLEDAPACAFRTLAPPELEATAFASYLLAPRQPLRVLVLGLAADFETWRGSIGTLVENAAVRLVAPAWLVARRAGEDGLLAEVVKVGDL